MFRFFLIGLLLVAAPALAQRESDAIRAVTGQETAATVVPEADPVIPLESNDSEIQARLSGLYSELSGLENVRPEVKSGVATLRGTTLTAEDSKRAATIAGRLAGVASVENEISVESNVGKRIEPLIDRSRELVDSSIAFIPLLLVALLVFTTIWLVGYVLTRKSKLFARFAPNELVGALVGQVIRLVFLVIGLILAMRIMGATALLGSVLGAAGVFGLAVGFAIRDTIENYIASILLSIRRPFAPNDLVVIEGYEGRVTRLNSRATFLTSLAGNEIRIPNAIVYKAKIENFTSIPERRFEFTVGIGYENDICTAMAEARNALDSVHGVLAKPEPVVLSEELGDSTISMTIMGWMNQRESDFRKVRSAAVRAVKERFEDCGISMPEPIQNVRLLHDEPQPEVRNSDGAPEGKDVEDTTDTSPDRTIERKVEELRSSSADDLLTEESLRE